MLISLEINDNKAGDFIKFLKELDFVKISQSEPNDEEYLLLLNERIEEYNTQKDSSMEAQAFLKKLKDQYGF